MSNSGYNTMSTIMVPIILSTIQHHRETSYNNSQYTTYIQRYASNHSILMTIEISRYISLYSAAKGAFLPIRERDLFHLDPQNTVMRELDPTYQGILFSDLSLEDLDLESIMGNEESPEMKVMIL